MHLPPTRPIYLFPTFTGNRADYHAWAQRLNRYLEIEQPPEHAVFRWLRYDVTAALPTTYRNQLEDAASVEDYLACLQKIFGSARAAMDLASKKIPALTSCKSNAAEDVLSFFNGIRELATELRFLDMTFPDARQPPSEAIICQCNIDRIRGKLNQELDNELVKGILNQGDYCSPTTTFQLLLQLEDEACK